MLRHNITNSPAWLSLTPVTHCLWLLLAKRYNNGEITLSVREGADDLGVSKNIMENFV